MSRQGSGLGEAFAAASPSLIRQTSYAGVDAILSHYSGSFTGANNVGFQCECCCGNKPFSEAYTLQCGHQYCKECWQSWLTGEITSGNVEPQCFYIDKSTGKCGVPLTEDEIRELVDPATFIKYERFQEMNKDDLMRECPFCTVIQKGSKSTPKITCRDCGRVFCRIHSNAHPGITCREYEEKHHKEFMDNRRAAGADAKECPKCGVLVSKVTGCNHMTCAKCKGEFCYVCGKDITHNVTEHYALGECNQFDTTPFAHNPFYCCLMTLFQTYTYIILSPIYVISLALTVIFLPVGFVKEGCFLPGFEYWRRNIFLGVAQIVFQILIVFPIRVAAYILALPFILEGCQKYRGVGEHLHSLILLLICMVVYFPLFILGCCSFCFTCCCAPRMLNPEYGLPPEEQQPELYNEGEYGHDFL